MAFIFTHEKTLSRQKKGQQLLILALVGVLFVTSFVVWIGFFKKSPVAKTPAKIQISAVAKKTEINFKVLQNKIFDELESPPSPLQIPQTIGRSNPFIPF